MPRAPRSAADPPAAPRATMAEVARRAGVSLGTVSNVLNGSARVAEARRAAVLRAIGELQYTPNVLAQCLRRRRSRVVGLCVPLSSSAYFAALLDSFEDIAAAQGYELMQVLSRHDGALEARRVDALLARRVDGLIIVPSGNPEAALDLVARSRVPAVIVDRESADRRFDYVTMDDAGAMRAAAKALLAAGHRRVAYVLRHPGLVTTRRRMDAFRATVGATRGAVPTLCVRDPDDRRFAAQLDALLRGPARVTALIASNSDLTIAILRVLRELGLACPRDVSLLAFDAPAWADVVTPPLAVIRPPSEAIARTAWELLLRRIGNAAARPRRMVLAAELALGPSVGPPPPPPAAADRRPVALRGPGGRRTA